MVANRIPADELKQRIDCRDVARALWGEPVKSRQRYDTHFAPWHTEKHASLIVYPNGFKHWGTGQRGSGIDLVILDRGCDFREAYEYVLDLSGGAAPAPRPAKSAQADSSEPPSLDWQAAGEKIVSAAQVDLFLPSGSAGLDYLHNRGLSDETIRAFMLGYARDKYGKGKIVIPYCFAGQLWAIHYRHLSGDLRYTSESGSKLSACLFNGDSIEPDRPAMLFEGAFDAMLATQHAGDLIAAVTVASCSNHASRRALAALNTASRVIVAYDNDGPGHDHAESNTPGLTAPYAAVYVPVGKDATEYVIDHAGDLRAWIVGALAAPALARSELLISSLPITHRAILNAYADNSIGPVLELWRETSAAGLVDPARTSQKELFEAGQRSGRNVNVAVIKKGVKRLYAALGSKFPEYSALQGSKARKEGGKNEPKAIPCRKTTYYTLPDPDEIKTLCRDLVLQYGYTAAIKHEFEKPIPHDDPTVEPFTAELIAGLCLDLDSAGIASLVTQIDTKFGGMIERQPEIKQRLDYARRNYERELRSVDDLRTAPIPAKSQYPGSPDYVASCARAVSEANGGETEFSKWQWRGITGKSPRQTKAILRRAGIDDVRQAAVMLPVANPADVAANRWHKDLKVPARRVIAQRDAYNWQAYSLDNPQLAAVFESEIAAGSSLALEYQPRNKQKINSEVQPVREKPVKPATPPDDTAAQTTEQTTQEKPVKPAKRSQRAERNLIKLIERAGIGKVRERAIYDLDAVKLAEYSVQAALELLFPRFAAQTADETTLCIENTPSESEAIVYTPKEEIQNVVRELIDMKPDDGEVIQTDTATERIARLAASLPIRIAVSAAPVQSWTPANPHRSDNVRCKCEDRRLLAGAMVCSKCYPAKKVSIA